MPTENTQHCPKCNDPDFVFEQGCLRCGWALSDQIEPTTDDLTSDYGSRPGELGEITTDVSERVCPNCGGIGDLHWPTCQPTPQVCQRGVDGSEALTPKEALDTLMRILLLLDSADNYEGVLPKARVLLRGVIGHWGDSSPPIEQVEMHGYDSGRVETGICQYRISGEVCGLKWDAPVHKVASESLNEPTRQLSSDLAYGIFGHPMPGDPENSRASN